MMHSVEPDAGTDAIQPTSGQTDHTSSDSPADSPADLATRAVDLIGGAALGAAEVQALCGALPCAVAITDAMGRPLVLNAAAEALLGVSFAELATAAHPARTLRLISHGGARLRPRDWPLALTLRSGRAVRGATLGLLRRDGVQRWLQVDCVPVLGRAGRVLGTVCSIADVTSLWQSAADLRPLAAIVASADDAMIGCSLDGTVFAWNEAAARLYGVSSAGALDRPLRTVLPAGHAAAIEGMLRRSAAGGAAVNNEADLRDQHGQRRRLSVTVSPIGADAGCVSAASVIVRDVTERRRAEAALAASERRYRELFTNATDMMFTHDLSGRFLSMNDTGLRTLGYTLDEVLRLVMEEIGGPLGAGQALEQTQRLLAGDGAATYEIAFLARDGHCLQLEVSARLISNHGRPAAVHGIARDVGERKRTEAQLRYQALHDALTGLPNRALFYDRLQQGIAAAVRDHESLALLFLDLDRFKTVNDALGHRAGDRLLRQIGGRLLGALRQTDTVARLGGDEFAVVLPGTDTRGAAVAAGKIVSAFRTPFLVDGRLVPVGASIGVALFPRHAGEPEALIHCADVAMYVAKRGGGGTFEYQPPDVICTA